jgi:protein involved in sex pheromone biosynthesis
MKYKLMFILLTAIFVLSACGEKAQPSEKEHELAHSEQMHVPNGDLHEVTASADILPAFLDKPEEMRLVYQVAGTVTDIIE